MSTDNVNDLVTKETFQHLQAIAATLTQALGWITTARDGSQPMAARMEAVAELRSHYMISMLEATDDHILSGISEKVEMNLTEEIICKTVHSKAWKAEVKRLAESAAYINRKF